MTHQRQLDHSGHRVRRAVPSRLTADSRSGSGTASTVTNQSPYLTYKRKDFQQYSWTSGDWTNWHKEMEERSRMRSIDDIIDSDHDNDSVQMTLPQSASDVISGPQVTSDRHETDVDCLQLISAGVDKGSDGLNDTERDINETVRISPKVSENPTSLPRGKSLQGHDSRRDEPLWSMFGSSLAAFCHQLLDEQNRRDATLIDVNQQYPVPASTAAVSTVPETVSQLPSVACGRPVPPPVQHRIRVSQVSAPDESSLAKNRQPSPSASLSSLSADQTCRMSTLSAPVCSGIGQSPTPAGSRMQKPPIAPKPLYSPVNTRPSSQCQQQTIGAQRLSAVLPTASSPKTDGRPVLLPKPPIAKKPQIASRSISEDASVTSSASTSSASTRNRSECVSGNSTAVEAPEVTSTTTEQVQDVHWTMEREADAPSPVVGCYRNDRNHGASDNVEMVKPARDNTSSLSGSALAVSGYSAVQRSSSTGRPGKSELESSAADIKTTRSEEKLAVGTHQISSTNRNLKLSQHASFPAGSPSSLKRTTLDESGASILHEGVPRASRGRSVDLTGREISRSSDVTGSRMSICRRRTVSREWEIVTTTTTQEEVITVVHKPDAAPISCLTDSAGTAVSTTLPQSMKSQCPVVLLNDDNLGNAKPDISGDVLMTTNAADNLYTAQTPDLQRDKENPRYVGLIDSHDSLAIASVTSSAQLPLVKRHDVMRGAMEMSSISVSSTSSSSNMLDQLIDSLTEIALAAEEEERREEMLKQSTDSAADFNSNNNNSGKGIDHIAVLAHRTVNRNPTTATASY